MSYRLPASMKMFLFNTAGILSATGASIEQILTRIGVHVVAQSPEMALDPNTFDAALVHPGQHDVQSTYLVALAMAKQKPVIYLLSKGKKLGQSVQHLLKDEAIKELLLVVEYTHATLERDLAQAVASLEADSLIELPTIKFTLRITPSMERYLQWKSKKTGLSKADFLRQVIQEQIIDKDQEFRDS